ncbi:MAG: thiamine phosphate synthase [Stomatobaculum sp.]
MKLSRAEMRRALRLYAVTDRRWVRENQCFADIIASVLDGGATLLQIREKELSDADFTDEVRILKPLCAARGVPCIVNDRIQVALAADADGVHVGQSDLGAGNIRALIGPDRILGITAKTVAQARAAEAAGADYIGAGAVFGSATKTDALAMSLELFREIAASVRIPAVAIGGISAGNVARLAGCGADGIAVVSGIFSAEDPGAAAAALFRLSGAILQLSD